MRDFYKQLDLLKEKEDIEKKFRFRMCKKKQKTNQRS
jgi:hypothetical protein